MVNVGNSMCRSIEMLALGMQPAQPQYMPHQQPMPNQQHMPTYYNFNVPTYSQKLKDPY